MEDDKVYITELAEGVWTVYVSPTPPPGARFFKEYEIPTDDSEVYRKALERGGRLTAEFQGKTFLEVDLPESLVDD